MNNLKKGSLLIISFKIPYPLNSGGAIAQYFFLSEMLQKYNVTFCTIAHNPYQKKSIDGLKKSFPKLKVEFLDLSSNSEKDNNPLTKLALRVNNKVAHILKGHIIRDDNYLDFNMNRIDENFILYIENLLKGNNYDIVQLEFFETLSLLSIFPKSVKKIFIHHEIRAKRNEFLNPKNTYSEYLNKVMKLNESSLLDLADVVVVFNKEDKEYLKNIKASIQISPFGIPDELVLKHKASRHFDKFLFIGSENHFPNKEGLSWFLDDIYLPNIAKIKLPVFITGEWTIQFKSKYRNNKNIHFEGFLESLEKIFDESVMITPIISGSGIRTKILQAFANNVPVISTRFASEGLYGVNSENKHILHFEDSNDFIQIMEAVNSDAKYLSKTAFNGNLFYTKNFGKRDLIASRFEIYSTE